MGERRQLGDREEVAAPAERAQLELAPRAEDAAAAKADPALVGGERTGERVDASARNLFVWRGDAEADEAAVERMRCLLQYGADVRAHRRVERRPRPRRTGKNKLE